ncbi:DUF3180 domain-containing protein [Schumannella soli]|uniref:DUF3180 domain-containing protein n=1 Tax=Schumannella soli TaxID=2590779 RepID=A0A506XNH5_9MICO|nr:DUF3180 domain-containing protein [Schumannella soli]TPW74214.1 DUF3180 domain-containing protein [Schumannella soli]
MGRTTAGTLMVLGVIGAVATFLLQTAVTSAGAARYEPAVSLPIAVVVIAAIVIILAVPIYRTTRGHSPRPVDPILATRIALLAKSSSLAGALLVGAALGLVGYLLTRSVAGVGSMLMAFAALGGAIILLVAGLVAEFLCTVPPHDDDDHDHDPPGSVRS